MCGRVYARLNRTDLAAVYALPSENIGHSIGKDDILAEMRENNFFKDATF